MSDLAGLVSVLHALVRAREDDFQRLRRALPTGMQPKGPSIELFDIGTDKPHIDAGAAVTVSGRRADGRLIRWLVEVWIYPDDDRGWHANVKAEIDLDDRDGADRCVLNEQQIIDDCQAVVEAIAAATTTVITYPLDQLLTAGWEPDYWDDDRDDAAERGTTVESTMSTAHGVTVTTVTTSSGATFTRTTVPSDDPDL